VAEDSGKETVDQIKAELERVNRALVMAKSEAGDSRKKLETIEAEKEKRDKATLSDTEKLQKEMSEMKTKSDAFQAELKEERIRVAIITEAMALGFENPAHAFALVDKSEVEITDGTVSGFEKSLKALAESGSLAMKDEKRSDGLGTPSGRGKPPSGLDKQEAPIVRF